MTRSPLHSTPPATATASPVIAATSAARSGSRPGAQAAKNASFTRESYRARGGASAGFDARCAIAGEARDRLPSAAVKWRVSGRALERRLVAVVIALAALLALNDALPYVGLRDDSCQTMFSSLEWGEDWNNHFFVPQRAVSDAWAYLDLRDVAIEPPAGDRRSRFVAEWLEAQGREHNTEAVRVAVDQLCAMGHRVSFAARRSDRRDQRFTRHEDACGVPTLSAPHRWLPVRVYETDVPVQPRLRPGSAERR